MKKKMNLIVAVDKNWGIGKDGDLLVKIPEDLKFFKEKTMGSIVIMGRKTMQSLPGQKPLPGRINVVLSKSMDALDGFVVVGSLEELYQFLESSKNKNVFVIGGAEIYQLLLPKCDKALITKIEAEFAPDRFMVNLDQSPQWKLTDSKPCSNKEYQFSYCTYRRL